MVTYWVGRGGNFYLVNYVILVMLLADFYSCPRRIASMMAAWSPYRGPGNRPMLSFPVFRSARRNVLSVREKELYGIAPAKLQQRKQWDKL
jgi:hypothetical protein